MMNITAKLPQTEEGKISIFAFIQVDGKMGVIGSFFDKTELNDMKKSLAAHNNSVELGINYLQAQTPDSDYLKGSRYAQAFFIKDGMYVPHEDSPLITFYEEEEDDE